MLIKVTDGTTIEHFEEVIPRASKHANMYLRTLAGKIQEYEPPVTMDLAEMTSGALRDKPKDCLAVIPTGQRFRHYVAAHYAFPLGGSLRVGWNLVGAERAGGIGWGIGAITDLEIDELISLTTTIHTYAVLPSIQEIADEGNGGGVTAGGFFRT